MDTPDSVVPAGNEVLRREGEEEVSPGGKVEGTVVMDWVSGRRLL